MSKKKIVQKKKQNQPRFLTNTKYGSLIILIIIGFLGVILYRSLQKDNLETQSKVQTLTIPTSSISTIEKETTVTVQPADAITLNKARELVVNYLEQLKLSSIEDDQRISDYSIEELSADMSDKFVSIEVTYSVKPVSQNSFWEQSTGELKQNGWIRNKYGCSALKKEDLDKALSGLGTGCPNLRYME